MATLRLTPGYELALEHQPEMLRGLERAADHVAEQARRYAPRRHTLPEGRKKHYADMLDGVAGYDTRGHAVGRVLALHFTSLWVELGTVHNEPAAPLRRGLDASQGRAL